MRKIPQNVRLANMKQGLKPLTWSDLQKNQRWHEATESLKRVFV